MFKLCMQQSNSIEQQGKSIEYHTSAYINNNWATITD